MCENCEGTFEILYTFDGILKFCKKCILEGIIELGLTSNDVFSTYHFGNLAFRKPDFIRNNKSFYRGM